MRRLVVEYEERTECPLCGGRGHDLDRIVHGSYLFGRLRIPYPTRSPDAIPLRVCSACGLVYKQFVPSPADLRRVLVEHTGEVWQSGGHPYDNVTALVAAAVDSGDGFDLLDVGSGDGGMLRLFSRRGGRRSALDIIEDPRCRPAVTGEYIRGFLDEPLGWAGRPYDLVLAFDILEHLYRPDRAFENLRRLLKPGGRLIVQTGDAEYPRDAAMTLREWYYLNLFEHHVCWTQRAFRFAARRYGFALERVERGPHKEAPYTPRWKRAAIAGLRPFGRWSAPREALVRLIHRDVRNLTEPGAPNHLTVVLRRLADRPP